MPMQISAEQAIAAIKGSRGFVTVIASRLDCSRQTVYNLLKKYKTVEQALYEEREGLKDFAEGKLFQQIDEGNTTAIIFYLKTQAKDRGYIEQQKLDVAVRNELESALAALEKKLSVTEYERVLTILAGDTGTGEIKSLPSAIKD